MSTELVAARMGAGRWAKPIEDTCIRFGIETTLEKAHFLAQLAHESDGFATAREYASGAAYEGRKDLGNIFPGDGRKFRGRGLIQITGRSNYAAYSLWKYGTLLLTSSPELLEEAPDAVDAAGWYWSIYRPACRRAALRDDLEGVTRAINGGTNGLKDRRERLEQAKRLFAEIRHEGNA